MLSDKMQAALNRQLNVEMESAYTYLAMAAQADCLDLPGFTNWFQMQYKEELGHAERIFNFILERFGKVELESIAKPELKSGITPLGLFQESLKHEQYVSKCIFDLKDLAKAESDHSVDVFLEWFVREQVEEEANTQNVIDQLKLVDGDKNGLFMIDRELAGRKEEAVG